MEGFERRRKISNDMSYRKCWEGEGGGEDDLCRELSLVHSTAQRISKTRIDIISVFERGG